MMGLVCPVLLLLSFAVADSSAWISGFSSSLSPRRTSNHSPVATQLLSAPSSEDDSFLSSDTGRRNVLLQSGSFLAATWAALVSYPETADALVKGNAPPPKMKPSGDKPKCTNVEECQAMAYQKEQEVISEQGPPPQVTAGGTRYRDLSPGSSDVVVKDGNEVTLLFQVLKLGKRSYDGLSGEGTVVFSRGYGLEDDEKKPGEKAFTTVVGNRQNIAALNDALLGMGVGAKRRFAIMPQSGWEKATKQCDGGPGGSGAGGDLKTDYVLVPTATMVSTEACFDSTKLPFPTTYAQQRRMAQRFDQSLIMEVEIVDIKQSQM